MSPCWVFLYCFYHEWVAVLLDFKTELFRQIYASIWILRRNFRKEFLIAEIEKTKMSLDECTFHWNILISSRRNKWKNIQHAQLMFKLKKMITKCKYGPNALMTNQCQLEQKQNEKNKCFETGYFPILFEIWISTSHLHKTRPVHKPDAISWKYTVNAAQFYAITKLWCNYWCKCKKKLCGLFIKQIAIYIH